MEGKKEKKIPAGSHVDIVERDSNGKKERIAVSCTLQEGDKVICEGDKELVRSIEQGVYLTLASGEQKLCKPLNGTIFLMALISHFDNPSGLFATEIKPPQVRKKKRLT